MVRQTSGSNRRLPREGAIATVAELEAKIAQYKSEIEEARKRDIIPSPAGPLKLDLGCGNITRRSLSSMTKDKGWTGVDLPGTEGADVHCDLSADRWPFPDGSVDEVVCAHMLEHVQRERRPHFFNELHRVLKTGAKATIITPHWASCRAYGDITHEWPPVSEFFWAYLDKEWRAVNAPHNSGFVCDFSAGYGYTLAAYLQGRNPEYVQEALAKWKEAAQDMQCTVTKVVRP